MKNKTIYTSFFMILLFCMGFMVSCSVNTGMLRGNPSLITGIEQNTPLPDYAYYYSGRSNLPYAVIGLDKKFNFNSRGWFKIENRQQVLEKISKIDDLPGIGVFHNLFPADIVDANGNRVGIWFSYYRHTGITVDHQANTLVVLNPYSPNGDRRGL